MDYETLERMKKEIEDNLRLVSHKIYILEPRAISNKWNGMKKKYKLTSEKKEWCGKTLFRIEAIASFGSVSKGDKGGFIEKEENLSQKSEAWVFDNAQVYGDAQVYGNARVFDNAWVSGNAQVYGDARVFDNAWVSGNAQVYGDARVSGKLKLSLGYFFGLRYKKEEIKYHKLDKDYKLIYKGNAKIEEGDDNAEKKAAILAKIEELKAEADKL